MSDWWAQKLGGGSRTQQTATQQPQAWFPQQQPQQWQQQQPQGPPKVTIHNLIESIGAWKGGPGARGSVRCPQCGVGTMYQRGPNMAPQCYECGANPRFAAQGQPRG